MNKQLRFTYLDKEYCLEYTRSTVAMMEKKGFVASDIETKPVTVLPALFAGAFLMHHRKVSTNTKLVEEIYSKFTNRDELISTLVKMYQEPILSLFDEPEEDEGNIVWGTD